MSKPLEVDIVRKDVLVGGKKLQILGRNAFRIERGEFAAILGKSGCGKSTLLRSILGLDHDFQGSIKLGDHPITDPGLDRGAVFQEARLMPWMTVKQNLEFAIPKYAKKYKALEQIRELIHLVGLNGFENAWPNQLSGGMAQRVAIARALVNIPDLLLLDEPFGALDSYTRMLMQNELARIVACEGTTTLMVTHDVDEAIFLSDKIIVMTDRPGSTSQIISIPIKRPRSRTDPTFVALRSKILSEVYSS